MFKQNKFNFFQFKIEFIIAINDFDLRHIVKDHLAKKCQKHSHLFISLKIICVFLLKYGDYQSLTFVSLTFNLLKLIYQYLYHPFQDFAIQQLEFSLTLTNMCISFIFVISQLSGQSIDFIICLVCCLPLSYKSGQFLIQFKLNGINENCFDFLSNQNGKEKSELQLEQIDLFIRFLSNNINFKLSQYMESPFSIYLEEIVAYHHKSCIDYPNCFCKKYQEEEISRVEFISEKIRQQYLEYFIQKTYIEECKLIKSETNEFRLNYYSFMISLMKNQNSSLREILSLKSRFYQKASIRQKQLISYLYNLASNQFGLDAQQLYLSKNGSLLDIIEFDESLDESSQQYRQCLKDKYDLLQLISKDHINLIDLEIKATNLQKKRSVLQDNLTKLFKVNSMNSTLLNLCEGFEECLTIDNVFRKIIRHQTKTEQKRVKIPHYSDDSCVVFISLLSEIGKILKVSKNFCQIVPLVKQNSEALGKNIKFMMNDEIGCVHDNILLNRVQNKSFNQDVQHYPVILGKDSYGWAVPYCIKIQVCMLGTKELGACGWIQQINDGYIYIMTSSIKDNFKLQLIDERFYISLFEDKFSKSEIKKIKLGSLMPILKYIVKKGSVNTVYESILILPNSLDEAIIERDIFDEFFLQNLQNMNLYSIKFAIYQINSQLVQFCQFQILQFKHLNDTQSKKEAIRNFRVQLVEFVDVDKQNNLLNMQMSKLNSIQDYSKKGSNSDEHLSGLNSLSLIAEESNHRSNVIQSPVKIQNKLYQNPLVKKSETETIHVKMNKNKTPSEEKQTINNIESQNNQDTPRYVESFIESISTINTRQVKECVEEKVNYPRQKSNEVLNLLVNKYIQSELSSFSPKVNYNTEQGGTSRSHYKNQEGNSKIQNGQRDSKTLLSPQNQSGQFTFNSNIEDYTYLNVLSQDSTHFSPQSSRRKLIPQVDTGRMSIAQAKVPDNQILESNYELQKDDIKKNSRPRNSSLMSVLAPHRKKNVSISNNIEFIQNKIFDSNVNILNAQKEEEQNGQLSSSNSNHADFNENGRKQTEDRENEGSVKSGLTTKSQTRVQMINTIRSEKSLSGHRFLNMFAVISIILICLLNVVSFSIQFNDQQQQKSNFQKIFWIYSVKKFLTTSLANYGLYSSLKTPIYGFVPTDEQNLVKKQVQANNNKQYINFKNFVNMMVEKNEESVYVFDLARDHKIQFIQINKVNSTIQKKANTTLAYEFLVFQNILYYTNNYLDTDGYYNNIFVTNYLLLYDAQIEVYQQNLQDFDRQISESKTLLIIQLVSITVVTVLFSTMMIPIQIFSQTKREEVLKLFSTLSPDKLIQMMQAITKYLDQQERIDVGKQKTHSIKGEQYSYFQSKQLQTNPLLKLNESARTNQLTSSSQTAYLKSIVNMKKKNISTTNDIPKLSFKLLFGIIIVLLSMQFYGVSKYIIGQSQIDSFQMSLNFLCKLLKLLFIYFSFFQLIPMKLIFIFRFSNYFFQLIYQLKCIQLQIESFDLFFDVIANLFSQRQLMTYYLFLSSVAKVDLTVFVKMGKQHQNNSRLKYNELIDQLKRYEDYDGYQSSGINQFLLPLFKENLCDVIQNDVNTFEGESEFDYESCKTVYKGVFEKGLLVASQKYIQLYDLYVEGAFTLNYGVFQQTLKSLYNEVSLTEEYEFTIMMLNLLKTVHNFFQDGYQKNYDQQITLSIGLLVIQILILVAVLFAGWRTYYVNLGKQFYNTRQLLDLIDLNILLDNPYVVSFLKKNN